MKDATEEFTPTPAKEWATTTPLDVELPSGKRARVRKPNPFFLARTGQVPKKVREAADAQAQLAEEVTLENLEAASVIVDFLIAKSFVEPKVSLWPVKDAVWVGDITPDDKAFLIEKLDLKL